MKENNNGNDTNVGSMENSIKETIKIIERKIKEAEHYSDITGLYLTLDKELCNAFINILSDYKRVLKENEELNYKLHSKKIALEIYNRYIPKSKVKDKIEELKQERDETYTKFLGGNRTDENLSTRGKMIEGGIKVLQELLEESEE